MQKTQAEKKWNCCCTQLKKFILQKQQNRLFSKDFWYTCEIGKPKESTFDSINSALMSWSEFSPEKIDAKATRKKRLYKKEQFLREMTAKQAQIDGLGIQENKLMKKGEALYVRYSEIKELLVAID